MKHEEIKDLMEFFDSTSASSQKIKNGEFEIEIEKKSHLVAASEVVLEQAPQVIVNKTEAITHALPPCEPTQSIKSPMVGTFYKAPAPGSAPFVKVGQNVKKGQVVAIVEAMKIMNEIEAEFDCKIVSNLVEDGQPVEFDMPIFAVEKL